MTKKKITAGLTGGIASGKSLAADMFVALGAYSIDTDRISRAVSESSEGKAALRRLFPQAFAGDTLDRAALRKIVFADGQARNALDSVMHPLIYRETVRQCEQADAPLVIVAAPLLFEAGFDALTRPNITVSCPESVRIERLMARDTIGKELARSMIAAQYTDAEREARADIVIRNDGTVAQLRAQVGRVYCELLDSGR